MNMLRSMIGAAALIILIPVQANAYVFIPRTTIPVTSLQCYEWWTPTPLPTDPSQGWCMVVCLNPCNQTAFLAYEGAAESSAYCDNLLETASSNITPGTYPPQPLVPGCMVVGR
jgi:hypothetical protein